MSFAAIRAENLYMATPTRTSAQRNMSDLTALLGRATLDATKAEVDEIMPRFDRRAHSSVTKYQEDGFLSLPTIRICTNILSDWLTDEVIPLGRCFGMGRRIE